MTCTEFKARIRLLPLGLAMALGVPRAALAVPDWNLQTPVTPIARQMYDLHFFIFWVCVVIFVAVFGVMFYSMFKHRKSLGHQSHPFHENTIVEIVWTVIPFLILLFMAFPATKTILAMKDTSAPGLTVKVTGNQWSWGYDYLQEGVSYLSNLSTPVAQIENRSPKGEHYLLEVDNEVVVPVGKKVRIIATAADVIHAWWIPALGAKQDAIPGFLRDIWFRAEQTGTFRGQCTELCGKEHGFMPIVVRVVSSDEYSKWVGEKKKALAAAADDPNKQWDVKELIARGEKVYAGICVACHQASGQGSPALKAPALAGNKFVVGAEQGPIDTVLNGRPNTAMQAFKQQLSDTEIAAVITYARNTWGNKASDVQPAEVKARRK